MANVLALPANLLSKEGEGMIYIAKFRFWLHIQLAAAPAANHGQNNWYDYKELIQLGCLCGKVFWRREKR
jgi:hypothetical protein